MKNINWTKISGLLLIGVCLFAMLLKYEVEFYRGTWIYKYGGLFSFFVFIGSILFSLFNTLLLISKYRTSLKNNLIWIFLSGVPFLYYMIMMILVMNQTVA
jgi:hypothetical protein